MFSGFAPQSKDADELSKALGNRTIMTGSVSSNKMGGNVNKTLQMMQQPLMTPDQIRALKRGHFILLKTGMRPARLTLHFFSELGIEYPRNTLYSATKRPARTVEYASKASLEAQLVKESSHWRQIRLENESDIRYQWSAVFDNIKQQERYDWYSVFETIKDKYRSSTLEDPDTGEIESPKPQKNSKYMQPFTVILRE